MNLDAVALAALRLQNGYALAIDTRDWDYFRTLFTPDVLACYPNRDYHGLDDWLGDFVPFHDRCGWTAHVMTNHVVGGDDGGIWATCYGQVQWTHADQPGHISRTTALYRDRLVHDGDGWRIAQRRLDLLLREPETPIPPSVSLPNSVEKLTGRL
ncbi:hypothetical protein Amsp01_049920 [Amycolatopsis sp. NBRC 101858]|uniref:nuclear transport factor 2 family protein n=1 Tax=Amycolatopsis sp. NBRC 101858 TaxID=3032200 RepID=UPI0024A0E4EF|nr:nuclear transport factor 2 family protein [Amycolatopsis sp. NBRC 101858]GLY38968.1 hypothetical protein Amsp01_049920 [Amycolatopsis sp. NBRC 101858]